MLRHRTDIDFLRATAIIAVLVYHFFPDYFPLGYLGVDIFFVISGYLITNHLKEELERTGSISFKKFYQKRILRLFPSLIFVLVLTSIAGYFLLTNELFHKLLKHAAAGGYISNYILLSEDSYFNETTKLKPLMHLWSLSIEEQFYLILPMLLILSYRFIKKTSPTIFLLFTYSICLWFFRYEPTTAKAFFKPEYRFWEILAGSLITYIDPLKTKKCFKILATLSLFSILLILNTYQYHGHYSNLIIVGITCLILLLESENSILFKNPFANYLAKTSYALYLTHWPIIFFSQFFILEPSFFTYSLQIFCTFIISHLMTFFIESKFQYKRHKRKSIYLFITFCVFSITSFTLYLLKAPSFNGNILDRIDTATKDWDYPDNLIKIQEGLYKLGDGKKIILVFGDSHAQQYAPAIRSLNSKSNKYTFYFLTHGGCPAVKDLKHLATYPIECDEIHHKFEQMIKEKFIHKIILASHWNHYLINKNDLSSNYLTNIKLIQQRLKSIQSLTDTILILPIMESDKFHPYRHLNYSFLPFRLEIINSRAEMTDKQKTLLNDFKKLCFNGNLSCFNPLNYYCTGNTCQSMVEDKLIMRDSNHLRPFLVLKMENELSQLIEK